MTRRVEGKVALITGAARGQGRSHAVRLASEGASIIALDIARPVERMDRFYQGATAGDLEETVCLVRAAGGQIVERRVDVRDLVGMRAAVDSGVQHFGGLDIVVANAGVFMFGEGSVDVAEEDWDVVIDVNLKGVWLTTKVATPHLLKRGAGSIILICSSAGLKGTPNVVAYTASKHGVLGLSRTMALELAPHGIRVNTVHPTSVATPMIQNDAAYRLFRPDLEAPTLEDALPAFATVNALPVPYVESSDVSEAVLFLASDESRYVTGTELKVDAGATLGPRS